MSSLILRLDLGESLLSSFRRLVLSFLVLGVPVPGFLLFSVRRSAAGFGFEGASFRLEAEEDGFG
jgi:hypothetical protein